MREESGISAFSTNSEDSDGPPVVLSKSFDIFAPVRDLPPEAMAKEVLRIAQKVDDKQSVMDKIK